MTDILEQLKEYEQDLNSAFPQCDGGMIALDAWTEIERNRAAIAELVGALKDARNELVALNGGIGWRDGEWSSVTHANATITKYDTPTTTKDQA